MTVTVCARAQGPHVCLANTCPPYRVGTGIARRSSRCPRQLSADTSYTGPKFVTPSKPCAPWFFSNAYRPKRQPHFAARGNGPR